MSNSTPTDRYELSPLPGGRIALYEVRGNVRAWVRNFASLKLAMEAMETGRY